MFLTTIVEQLFCRTVSPYKQSFDKQIILIRVNPNLINLKWRIKRKHSPVKFLVLATEIPLVEICL